MRSDGNMAGLQPVAGAVIPFINAGLKDNMVNRFWTVHNKISGTGVTFIVGRIRVLVI